MKIYAVIDTNVIVSAMITSNIEAPTVKIVDAALDGRITLMYDEKIVEEYYDVLSRPLFGIPKGDMHEFLGALFSNGEYVSAEESGEKFADEQDAVFYNVATTKDGAFLISGNTRHYPKNEIVITPSEMVEILEK
ncbi:MAG: putative toxin-antitoxin system toxin component, PIN family [Bacillota bacterium]|nr:putative toxin-antitoxin system toxin component, PIN family [Bacillota bacterium]